MPLDHSLRGYVLLLLGGGGIFIYGGVPFVFDNKTVLGGNTTAKILFSQIAGALLRQSEEGQVRMAGWPSEEGWSIWHFCT